MNPLAIYTVVLAVINYPFVLGVEWSGRRSARRAIFAVAQAVGQREREIGNSWLTTPVHAVLFIAFIGTGALRTAPEGLLAALATFALTFLWTEIWHYASHVAMHTRPLLFIHREHHRSHVTGAWSAVSFSLLEKLVFSLGILGGLALVSRLHPLSALGIFAYYVVYFYSNALGHANVEIRGPTYYRGIWAHLFNTPTYHALHHARYVRNYGLMTPWLDRLFGTGWFDVAAVQARVASGRPLTRLGEKCREGGL